MNEIFLQNGKKIWLSILSVRKFKILTNHADITIIKDNNNFQEIKFSNLLSFKKGEKIVIKDNNSENYITFILNDISSVSKTCYEGIEQKINKSSIFILPFIGENHLFFDYGYSLYNVYISEDYKFLYVKYKWTGSKEYLDLEENLTKHPLYIEFWDESKDFVIFKFKIDDKYHKSIDCIMNGKYSNIEDIFKLRILSFHGLNKSSKLGGVLFRDENYKKSIELELNVKIPDNLDLMSKSTKEEEIWSYQDTSQKIGIES